MRTRTKAVSNLVLFAVYSCSVFGQQKPAASAPAGVQEFPVTMEQSVTAGKTPAGTKIQAKLEVATLLDGVVIPRDAVFSGEVVESVAKTKGDPSRVAIRMDSVQWKNGSASTSAAVKVYLTSWYYPTREEVGRELQYGPQQPANRGWNGQGQYPDANSKVYKPFPGSDTDKSSSVPDTPSATASNHRVLMKDVDPRSGTDGALVLVSKRNTIKLDKLTTYVLASGDLMPAK